MNWRTKPSCSPFETLRSSRRAPRFAQVCGPSHGIYCAPKSSASVARRPTIRATPRKFVTHGCDNRQSRRGPAKWIPGISRPIQSSSPSFFTSPMSTSQTEAPGATAFSLETLKETSQRLHCPSPKKSSATADKRILNQRPQSLCLSSGTIPSFAPDHCPPSHLSGPPNPCPRRRSHKANSYQKKVGCNGGAIAWLGRCCRRCIGHGTLGPDCAKRNPGNKSTRRTGCPAEEAGRRTKAAGK